MSCSQADSLVGGPPWGRWCCLRRSLRVPACLEQHAIDRWAFGRHRRFHQVFVMWEKRQLGEVRRAVVTEDQLVASVLAVIPVIEVLHAFVLDDDGLADLEQPTAFEPYAHAKVGAVGGEQLFEIELDVTVAHGSEGCLHLGTEAESGRHAERDLAVAARHYRRACDLGQPVACYRLSLLLGAQPSLVPDLASTLVARRACRAWRR